MLYINQQELEDHLQYEQLIPALKNAFSAGYDVPMRHHHDYPNPSEGKDSTLLLMPAWEAGKYLGVKLVTVSPNNGKYQLPSIQGIYILFDAHKGNPIAQMEAKTLTTMRTAAASALASTYLSRTDSQSLLMIGTGALAPRLIEAHASIRPIKEVYVWGRNFEKAEKIVAQLSHLHFNIQAIKSIESTIKKVDIISCATLSPEPLVFGTWLQPGQHLDLVGAYRPDMREADDEAIKKAAVFVDTYEGACKECGDILIPIKNGILSKESIRADLRELTKGIKTGRKNEEEITLFKSVGHALEDLAAAKLIYEMRNKQNK